MDMVGTLRFFVQLDVPMSEMRQWSAARIEAFFAGLAAAKNARENWREGEPVVGSQEVRAT